MKKFKNWFVAVLVVLAVMPCIIGCSGLFSAPYKLEYEVVSSYGVAKIVARITGPADNLAVILVGPNERPSDSEIIKKEDMVTGMNSVTVSLKMDKNLPEGTYTIVVKSVEKDKVVFKSPINLTAGEVACDGVFVEPNLYIGGYRIGKLSFIFHKTGNLPIAICMKWLRINGEEIGEELMGRRVMVLPKDELVVDTWAYTRGITGKFFNPGDHLSVTGEMTYASGKLVPFGCEYEFPPYKSR
jgi:hypothetical protein